MSSDDIAVKHYACPRCGAPAGERCRVASGVTFGRPPHASRMQGVWRGWQEGFSSGMRNALDLIAEHGPDEATEILRRRFS